MGKFILKRRLFSTTIYDETDALKRMKDSDILAEKKKDAGYGRVATGAAAGALSVGLAGGLLRASGTKALNLARKAPAKRSVAGSFARGGYKGAMVGATVGALAGLATRNKDVKQYNDRLEYAQRQARRREKADWKSNMTQRDGYSY